MMMRNKSLSASRFETWRNKNLSLVEGTLTKILNRYEAKEPSPVQVLVKAMRYSLLSGGKRVRPLLALAAAEAVEGRTREALPAAMAVEMVHAYSLIHDDLPAMDDDDLRRGRPTCHRVFGEAVAVLAGDALLTLAFEVLAESGRKSPEAAFRAAKAALGLAKAAGAVGMVGGQALDLAFEKRPEEIPEKAELPDLITAEMVRDMESRKTGELMAAALYCGGVMAGAGEVRLRSLMKLVLTLGLAFQIQDDLLNLSGDPALLGKAVGSDRARGKASFPAVMSVPEAEEEFKLLTDKALSLASSFRQPGQCLYRIIEGLIGRNS